MGGIRWTQTGGGKWNCTGGRERLGGQWRQDHRLSIYSLTPGQAGSSILTQRPTFCSGDTPGCHWLCAARTRILLLGKAASLPPALTKIEKSSMATTFSWTPLMKFMWHRRNIIDLLLLTPRVQCVLGHSGPPFSHGLCALHTWIIHHYLFNRCNKKEAK